MSSSPSIEILEMPPPRISLFREMVQRYFPSKSILARDPSEYDSAHQTISPSVSKMMAQPPDVVVMNPDVGSPLPGVTVMVGSVSGSGPVTIVRASLSHSPPFSTTLYEYSRSDFMPSSSVL